MANFDDLLNSAPSEEQTGGTLTKEEYAAKKQAEREEVFALSDLTAMEVSSNGDTFKKFLDLQGRLDRYSAVNVLLVFAKNRDASRLGGFDFWKSQNAFVKPGETGISILEPGNEYERADGSKAVGYNVKKVFDISQVDTRKLKSASTVTYNDRQLLTALLTKPPVRISGVDNLPDNLGAMTDPKTGEIRIRKGMEFPDTFRSVAQELSFADLTTGGNTQADPHFSAYCAAYLLCRKYGVDVQGFSFENAPGVFDGMEAQTIKGELTQIRDAAEDISGRMARQLEMQSKVARSQDAR
ncbi:MAG: hypothetical protein ABF449_04960 [Ethanoligenens sp.]